MQKKRRKVLVCQKCGRHALKFQPACPSCGELNTLVEITAEKAAAVVPVEALSAVAQAVVERLHQAWALPRKSLESAVRLVCDSKPQGAGLDEALLERVAENAIEAHKTSPKDNPVGFFVTLGRQAAVGEGVASDGDSSGGWDQFSTAGVGVKRLAELLPAALEAPAPPVSVSEEEPPCDPDCSVCSGFGFVRRGVPFGHPDFGRAFPCPEEPAERRVDRLRHQSGLEGMLADMRLETLQVVPELEEALREAERFVSGDVSQLVLTGVTGCGKTHIAAGVAHRMIDASRPVLFIPVARYLDRLRHSYDEEAEESFYNLLLRTIQYPVLLLDDLGAEAPTRWAREKLYEIIDARYVRQMPMLVTSNQPPHMWDVRVRSRLCDWQRSAVVDIKAGDYRLQRRMVDDGKRQEPAGVR